MMDDPAACSELHRIAATLPEVRYPFAKEDLPLNGIYFFYEHGEHSPHGAPEGRRIVRVGTHREGNFRSRMADHYLLGRHETVRAGRPAHKDRSIFRKNIGRAILQKASNAYLSVWEIDFTTRANREAHESKRDLAIEQATEDEISRLLRAAFTFRFLHMTGELERMGGEGLEARLIGTLARCPICGPSAGWLGLHSPKPEIRSSGLWLSQHLTAAPLDEEAFERFRALAERCEMRPPFKVPAPREGL